MGRKRVTEEVIVKMTGQRLVVHHVTELYDRKFPQLSAGTVVCKNPKWVPVPEPEFLFFQDYQVENIQRPRL